MLDEDELRDLLGDALIESCCRVQPVCPDEVAIERLVGSILYGLLGCQPIGDVARLALVLVDDEGFHHGFHVRIESHGVQSSRPGGRFPTRYTPSS